MVGGVHHVPPTIQTWPGGYPIQSWWGVPQVPVCSPGTPPPSDLGWGTPHHPDQGWGTPPPSDLGWGTPPPSDLGWGTPLSRPVIGYFPPPSDLGWGTPHHQTWDGVPPIRPGMGYPPTDGEQTDIPKYKYYLPSYYVRGR